MQASIIWAIFKATPIGKVKPYHAGQGHNVCFSLKVPKMSVEYRVMVTV